MEESPYTVLCSWKSALTVQTFSSGSGTYKDMWCKTHSPIFKLRGHRLRTPHECITHGMYRATQVETIC
jgi:hypothetical protein